MIGLLANEVDPSDSTLWETPWLLVHVHVTVPPTATVSTAGLAVPLWALMNTTRPSFPTVTDPAGPPPPPPPHRRHHPRRGRSRCRSPRASRARTYRCPVCVNAFDPPQLALRELDFSQLRNRNPPGAASFGSPGPGRICSCSSSILFLEQFQQASAKSPSRRVRDNSITCTIALSVTN